MRCTRKIRESGEIPSFRQLGFAISFLASGDAEASAIGPILEAFRYEVLAPNSLECGGRCDQGRFQGFVTRWEGSASEGDRREVSKWLSFRPEITEYDVGKLVEAWHGV